MSTRPAAGAILTFRRDGSALHVKPGDMEEAPLVARSETRFSAIPGGAIVEFQVDGQGTVTGALMQQGHGLSRSSGRRARRQPRKIPLCGRAARATERARASLE